MNILFVSDFTIGSAGGVQSSVDMQRRELRRQGHRVVMLCPHPGSYMGFDADEDVLYVPSFKYLRPSGSPVVNPLRYTVKSLVVKLLGIADFEIVHAHTTSILGLQASKIASALNVPLIQTMHGRDDVFAEQTFFMPWLTSSVIYALNYAYAPHKSFTTKKNLSITARNQWNIMLNYIDRADAVTIPSQHFTNKFISHGAEKRKLNVLSNGLDDQVIDAIPYIKRQFSAPLRLLWCGRISSEKRPECFIELCEQLGDKVIGSIYGDGPLTPKIRQQIAESRAQNMTFYGRYKQSEIYPIMQANDVLIYSSHDFDNQPMIMLEATASGLPVVFCDPDLAECMPGNGARLTVSPASISFAEAINELSSQDAKLPAMERAMYAHRDNIRQSHLTKQMLELYQTCLNRQKQ